MRTVVSMVGMEDNPSSLAHRAAYAAGPLLRRQVTEWATTVEEASLSVDDVVSVLEGWGFLVVGHVKGYDDPFPSRDEDPDHMFLVSFQSTVQLNAYAKVVVRGDRLNVFIQDMGSSGMWYCLGYSSERPA